MSDYVFVYITASSEDEAAAIGRALVSERLVACVNILPNMRSIYRWQGEIADSQEVVLIAKSRAEAFEEIEARVKAMHSYSCPCIVALPIQAGAMGFLQWIDEMTVLND